MDDRSTLTQLIVELRRIRGDVDRLIRTVEEAIGSGASSAPGPDLPRELPGSARLTDVERSLTSSIVSSRPQGEPSGETPVVPAEPPPAKVVELFELDDEYRVVMKHLTLLSTESSAGELSTAELDRSIRTSGDAFDLDEMTIQNILDILARRGTVRARIAADGIRRYSPALAKSRKVKASPAIRGVLDRLGD